MNSDDDAMVVFNLEQGRRNDPIEAQQLVASVDRQQAISQAVMAQQLGSISDPSIIPGPRREQIRLIFADSWRSRAAEPSVISR